MVPSGASITTGDGTDVFHAVTGPPAIPSVKKLVENPTQEKKTGKKNNASSKQVS